MRISPEGLESSLAARGPGSFGRVEYGTDFELILRLDSVKSADSSGVVRVYFDTKREQVVTGRMFEPMSSGLIGLRPGQFYKVYTTLALSDDFPEDVKLKVEPSPSVSELFAIVSGPIADPVVSFIIQPFRRVELVPMVDIARLSFFVDDVKVEEAPAKTQKSKSNSSRTKKKSESTPPSDKEEE